LNDGRIRIFTRRIFQGEGRLPCFSILRNGHIQWRTPLLRVVVDQQVTPVGQRDGVES
jgi:hypothetical protein